MQAGERGGWLSRSVLYRIVALTKSYQAQSASQRGEDVPGRGS